MMRTTIWPLSRMLRLTCAIPSTCASKGARCCWCIDHMCCLSPHRRPIAGVVGVAITESARFTLRMCRGFERPDPRDIGFDAAVEFPPNMSTPPSVAARQRLINPEFNGDVLDWRELARDMEQRPLREYTLYPGVNPGWDNEPRRSGKGRIYLHASPRRYRDWLMLTVRNRLKKIQRLRIAWCSSTPGTSGPRALYSNPILALATHGWTRHGKRCYTPQKSLPDLVNTMPAWSCTPGTSMYWTKRLMHLRTAGYRCGLWSPPTSPW